MPIIVHWEKEGKQDSLWFEDPKPPETIEQFRDRVRTELTKRGYDWNDCWSERK